MKTASLLSGFILLFIFAGLLYRQQNIQVKALQGQAIVTPTPTMLEKIRAKGFTVATNEEYFVKEAAGGGLTEDQIIKGLQVGRQDKANAVAAQQESQVQVVEQPNNTIEYKPYEQPKIDTSTVDSFRQQQAQECQQKMSEYNACLSEYNAKLAEYNSCLVENASAQFSPCSKPYMACSKPICMH